MASIELSGIGITETRGSLGTTVFSRNRYGNYTRTRVTPFQPNSPDQVGLQNIMSDLNDLWQLLSDEEREIWNITATRTKKRNRVGKFHSLAGYNYFIKTSFNILAGGGIPQMTPPPIGNTDNLVLLKALSASPTELHVRVRLAQGVFNVTPNVTIGIACTTGVSVGRTSVKSGFCTLFFFGSPDNTFDFDMIADYTPRFGAPISGTKIFVRARLFDAVYGVHSMYLYSSVVVS